VRQCLFIALARSVATFTRLALLCLIVWPLLPAWSQPDPSPPPQWQTTLMEKAGKLISSGQVEAGLKALQAAADKGDDRGMVQLGLYHYRGQHGLRQDYARAHEYFSRALGPTPYPKKPGGYQPNGFAVNNLGVMFRDGLGVPQNRQIAHALFTFEYAANGYSEESVGTASGNLNRDARELDKREQNAAMCLNMQYVWAYVKGKGVAKPVAPDAANPRIRDWKDWLPGEIANVTC
jgi:TPR repeat protein